MLAGGEIITGDDFRRMIAGAYQAFMVEHEYINSLNVFPVPDGDTGTNMLMTLAAVAQAVSEAADSGIGSLSKRAADSAIMGARGNSGVILSQIFRGIARGLSGKQQVSSAVLGKAFQYGVLYAYRAVARPVEGTILTVAKGIAKGTQRAVREGGPFVDILIAAIAAGEQELAKTPELLPALKAAGVVDAGGKGLIVFLSGCLEGLTGVYAGPEAAFGKTLIAVTQQLELAVPHPYCTEFMIKNCSINIKEARQQLLMLGESLVLAEGDELLKVHIHTAHPGEVLESAITWGSLHDIKIDNMADQHRQGTNVTTAERSSLAVISVAAGEGLAQMMLDLGASQIIPGGQSMNPPVEEFIDAVHRGNADRYIILPNNKNIILVATQVKKLLGDVVEIVPTVNVPQGLAALVAFSAKENIQKNVAQMTTRLSGVKAAGVTVAVRDSLIGQHKVAAGSFIGVVDTSVQVAAADLESALLLMVTDLLQPGDELVGLYYGSAVSQAEAEQISQKLALQLPAVAVELYYGGQPHYHFFISIE